MVEMIQGEAKLFKSLKEQKTYVQYNYRQCTFYSLQANSLRSIHLC